MQLNLAIRSVFATITFVWNKPRYKCSKRVRDTTQKVQSDYELNFLSFETSVYCIVFLDKLAEEKQKFRKNMACNHLNPSSCLTVAVNVVMLVASKCKD